MFNRLRKLNAIGRSLFDSLSVGSTPPVDNPPYGTIISTACGSGLGQGLGDNYTDAFGNYWYGMFKKYNYIADGNGGALWVPVSDNDNPCYYPYGYINAGYFNSSSYLTWEHDGTSGTYDWGVSWDYNYWDGAGGLLYTNGTLENNPTGYELSEPGYWADGKVVYVSVGSYAFWYNYGYYLGTGSGSIDYVTSCGSWPYGGYNYDIYADGYGGTYTQTTSGGWYPSGFLGYCDGYNYYHDGMGNVTAENAGGGGGGGESYPSYGTYLDGSSNPITTEIYFDGYVNGNYQSSNTSIEIGYSYNNTYADGQGGSYTESGSSWSYADGTDIFTAPFGNELKLDWSFEDPSGSYNGQFKWADELGVWKINQGSTYMDRMYVAPLVSDGYVIFEGNSYAGENGQYKTQIILQNGIWISNTINF